MNYEVEKIPTNNLTIPTTVVHQNGSRNMHVDHVDKVNYTYNIIMAPPTKTGGNVSLYSKITISRDYYNLFVIADEDFSLGHFTVPKDRSLTSYTNDCIKVKYASLDNDAIEKIKTFPSIFASENHEYGSTDENHFAIYGLVTNIRIQETGIKIYFHPLNYISQQHLNILAPNLGIRAKSRYNELNHTHWTIKQVDLIEELTDAGISLMAPTL